MGSGLIASLLKVEGLSLNTFLPFIYYGIPILCFIGILSGISSHYLNKLGMDNSEESDVP